MAQQCLGYINPCKCHTVLLKNSHTDQTEMFHIISPQFSVTKPCKTYRVLQYHCSDCVILSRALLNLCYSNNIILKGSNALILTVKCTFKICCLPNSNLPGVQTIEVTNFTLLLFSFPPWTPLLKSWDILSSSQCFIPVPIPKVFVRSYYVKIYCQSPKAVSLSDCPLIHFIFTSNQNMQEMFVGVTTAKPFLLNQMFGVIPEADHRNPNIS